MSDPNAPVAPAAKALVAPASNPPAVAPASLAIDAGRGLHEPGRREARPWISRPRTPREDRKKVSILLTAKGAGCSRHRYACTSLGSLLQRSRTAAGLTFAASPRT